MELLTSDVLTRRPAADDRTSCRGPANRFYISIFLYIYTVIVMYIVIYICIYTLHWSILHIKIGIQKDWDTKSWHGSWSFWPPTRGQDPQALGVPESDLCGAPTGKPWFFMAKKSRLEDGEHFMVYFPIQPCLVGNVCFHGKTRHFMVWFQLWTLDEHGPFVDDIPIKHGDF